MKILHLHVKKIYWDEVLAFKKKEEYRAMSEYWKKRLSKTYDCIYYHLGYPKRNDTTKTIIFLWRGYSIKKITHGLFGKDVNVYAIPLGVDNP